MRKVKLLSIILIMTILFNIISPVFTYAVTNAKLEIVNSAGNEQILVAAGEKFSVDVNFEKGSETGLSLSGAVKFDNTKLKITNLTDQMYAGVYNIKDKTNLAVTEYASCQNRVFWDPTKDSEYVAFLFQSDDTQIKSGKAFTLQFEVLENVTGTFDIEFYNIEYVEDANEQTPVYLGIDVGEKITGTIKTPLTSIALNKTETTIGIGENEKLSVTYTPSNTTDSKTITWKSNDTSIATVDAEGNITAVAPGETTITATSAIEGVAAVDCKVTVTSKLQSIAINKSSVEMAKGDTEKLSVTYTPSNTTDSKKITWESNNTSIATVDSDGNVTAIANGEAIITATSEVTGIAPVTCKISVTSKLKDITLNETEFNLNKGESKTLVVSYDPIDTTDSKTIAWSSNDSSIADVDDNGKVTAVKPGTTTIIATCNGKTAMATVNVKSPLTGIEINEGDKEITPIQELNLTVSYLPEDTTDSKTIEWESSDNTIATVDSTGKVTANKPGTVTITATCGLHSDSITVKVLEVHTESIAFKEANVTLNKTEEKQAEIIYYPSYTTDDKTVTYSSKDETIATVDANGKITAKAAGTTEIVAKVGSLEATCAVTVKVPLTGISLNKNETEIIKNATEQLNLSYNEADTTDDKTITWTSMNENVATVNNDGLVTAKGAGTAIIKAEVGNYSVTCEVTVKVPLTGIEIKESTSLIKNESETLTVTYLPEDTTDDRTVTWSSEDETVATVDANGKITAKKEGTTNVVAKVGNFEEKCEVEVKEIKLEGIEINNKIDVALKGQTFKLEVLYTPENTTDDKAVVWTSSDESIVKVDSEGNVTALKAGEATITAKSGSFEDEYDIEVIEIPMTGMEIEINSEDKQLKEGEKIQLNVKFTPENTTDNKNVKYLSSDESILTVDDNGIVKALTSGTAVVTVIAENGTKTQIKLTVEAEKVIVDAGENKDQNADKNSDKKEESEKVDTNQKDESPKTGDINLPLYILLIVISLIGIVKFRKTSKK